ncbi:MAG: AbrB/MazE/SpoVT family DNA-binding domain-containing protein [Acutalibacteraceae bacterium]
MKMYRIIGKNGRITIPYEIREKIGFAPNDVISFESDVLDDRSVIVRREMLCDMDDVFDEELMDEEMTGEENSDEALLDFINSLSEEEQRAALIHLSVKWAERQADFK